MSSSDKIVKICGLKTVEAATKAINSGANLLGVILVPNRARTIDHSQAKQISKLCKTKRECLKREYVDSKDLLTHVKYCVPDYEGKEPEWFEYCAQKAIDNGPYLVGVFRNQQIDEVLDIANELELDFVQLHGSEDFPEFCKRSSRPVIARYVLKKENIKDAVTAGSHYLPLLDSEVGGEGKVINWDDAALFCESLNGRYILAGGLTPENVKDALKVNGCVGVDVSGGVETGGLKDLDKIEKFVTNALNI